MNKCPPIQTARRQRRGLPAHSWARGVRVGALAAALLGLLGPTLALGAPATGPECGCPFLPSAALESRAARAHAIVIGPATALKSEPANSVVLSIEESLKGKISGSVTVILRRAAIDDETEACAPASIRPAVDYAAFLRRRDQRWLADTCGLLALDGHPDLRALVATVARRRQVSQPEFHQILRAAAHLAGRGDQRQAAMMLSGIGISGDADFLRLFHLGRALRRVGMSGEAYRVTLKALDARPTSLSGRYNAACYAALSGQPRAEVLGHLDALVSQVKDPRQAQQYIHMLEREADLVQLHKVTGFRRLLANLREQLPSAEAAVSSSQDNQDGQNKQNNQNK